MTITKSGNRWCLKVDADEIEALAILLEEGTEDILAADSLDAAKDMRMEFRRHFGEEDEDET